MPDYATTNYPTTTRRGPNSKTTLMRAAVGPGEIVQVQGGHIIRATGRKDRHSKVYTAKGPRDRRVRLSAHTAIQFYDVQDRLGYDRPSKAVDWLIKKAKDAIDKLDHLPPFNPTQHPPLALEYPSNHHNEPPVDEEEVEELVMVDGREGNGGHSESSGYESIQQQIQHHHHHQQIGNGGGDGSTTTAGLSLDSHTSMVADTMRSFFPTSSTEHGQMNSIGFHQNYDPNTHTTHHHQDLGLSLHSFSVDPVTATSHTSFPSGFESTGSHHGWGVDQNHHQQQQSEMGRFSRLLAWSCGGSGGGFGSSSSPQGVVIGNNSPATGLLFGDRETLQSSFSHPQHHQQSSIRVWDDLPPPMERQHHDQSHPITGGISDHGFMTGFCIPEIQHHGINLPIKYNNNDNKTSSMSTESSH